MAWSRNAKTFYVQFAGFQALHFSENVRNGAANEPATSRRVSPPTSSGDNAGKPNSWPMQNPVCETAEGLSGIN